MNIRRQQGYALLIMTLSLLGVGAGLMSTSVSMQITPVQRTSLISKEQYALLDARQSLLSYAALYPYLYGPTGAGPGHFPCPDTDAPLAYKPTSVSHELMRRDGPNPPCANQLQSVGMLPRHTLLPGHRYLFHAQPFQRIHYSVAGQVVNNPLNRTLHLADFQQPDAPPLAVLSLASNDKQLTQARVAISQRSALPAVSAGVAMWLTERVNEKLTVHCQEHRFSEHDEPVHNTSASTTTVSCIELLLPPNSECVHDALFVLVLDGTTINDDTCLFDNLSEHLLEGVPATRHWFVRNQWYLSVTVEDALPCDTKSTHLAPCSLVWIPINNGISESDKNNITNIAKRSLHFGWEQNS